MSEMRKIDVAPFVAALGTVNPGLGPVPQLQWIEIENLVIDPRYQREIFSKGRANVLKIAREFDWTKFAPVIVAPVIGGGFAIVDGQHRTTGAALRGIEKVPCFVIMADPSQQAAAFAAINGNVTAMTPMQIYHARVAAGEEQAVALHAALEKAGISICRYPVSAKLMKPGETFAVGILSKLHRLYPEPLFVLALRCLVAGAKGKGGLIRASLCEAMCSVLDGEPGYVMTPSVTLRAAQSIDLEATLMEAEVQSKRTKVRVSAVLTGMLFEQMEPAFSSAAA